MELHEAHLFADIEVSSLLDSMERPFFMGDNGFANVKKVVERYYHLGVDYGYLRQGLVNIDAVREGAETFLHEVPEVMNEFYLHRVMRPEDLFAVMRDSYVRGAVFYVAITNNTL